MSKKVTGMLIDAVNGFHHRFTLDDELESYYQALKCTCFDVTYRNVGGKCFAIYCDDNGFLRDDPIPSALNKSLEVQLVGNLFVAKVNAAGETESLTPQELRLVERHIRLGVFTYNGDREVHPFLLLDD